MCTDVYFDFICKSTHPVCAREDAEVLLTPSMRILSLTREYKIPENRELVDDNDRHLHTWRNIQNRAWSHGVENGEDVLAMHGSVSKFSAIWQRVEIRPPHCAHVVNIGVRYAFAFKPIRVAISNKNFLSSRNVFYSLESVCVHVYALCIRATYVANMRFVN